MQFTTLIAFAALASTAVYIGAALSVPSQEEIAKPDAHVSAGYTCDNWSIVSDTADLAADCQDDGGYYYDYTRISISDCMGNQNGHLGCQSG